MSKRKQVNGWRDVLTATGRGRVLARVQQANELFQADLLKGQNMKTKKAVVIEVFPSGDAINFRVRSPNGKLFGHDYNDRTKGHQGAKALVEAIRGEVHIVHVDVARRPLPAWKTVIYPSAVKMFVDRVAKHLLGR